MLTNLDVMKALQIQQSARINDRASRSISSAIVVNISEKACLSIGIIAIVALFISIGFMCFKAVIASGITALLAVAAAPSLRQKGGDA